MLIDPRNVSKSGLHPKIGLWSARLEPGLQYRPPARDYPNVFKILDTLSLYLHNFADPPKDEGEPLEILNSGAQQTTDGSQYMP